MLGLFGQPTCSDNCFLRGNKHLMARLVYGGAALGICLLSLYHGHRDNLALTWSLIACPLRWQDGERGVKGRKALQSLSGSKSI